MSEATAVEDGQPQPQPQPQPQTPGKADWASVPLVNLLPPEILQQRRFKRGQRWLAVTVLAAVALLGAATWWAQTQVSTAEDGLAAETAQTTVLEVEEAKYAEVPRVLAQVSAAQRARQQSMASDVLWYRFLNDLALATPGGVSMQSVQATLQPAGAAGAAGAAASAAPSVPLKPAGIGTVTVDGTTGSFDQVSTWLENFADISGLDASTLSTANRSDSDSGSAEVQFSSGITMTGDALSHRYEQKAG
jgi:Tfp pilus assembly protein PilN